MDVFRGIPENICQVIAAVCSSPILPKLDKGSLCGAKAESYAARKGFFSVQKKHRYTYFLRACIQAFSEERREGYL